MGEAYRLWTPEQIEVRFDVAGVGSRMLAGCVDLFIQIVALLALALAAAAAESYAHLGSSVGFDLAAALLGLVLFVVYMGYFVGFEWLWNGQTPGKRLLGLRVIRDGGAPIGLSEAGIRNVVRIVDMLPGAYLIGMTVMLLNRRSKRLGDLAAGTIVVKERRRLAFDRPSDAYLPAGAEPALLPDVSRLTSDDFLLVRRYLQRRETISVEDRRRLARQVLTAVGARLEWPPGAETPDDPQRQLELVATAYREREQGR